LQRISAWRAFWVAAPAQFSFVTGASAPEILVQRVVDRISAPTGAEVGQLAGVDEGVSFPLPKGLA
jgi:4-hydroxy-3-methylbut-2-en-1-yl diphosphate reductase